MKSGIPQGSVLGPYLFSTYESPFFKIIPDMVKLKLHQYADDTQLYCSLSTSEFTSEVTRLQDCERDVSNWFLTNCMQLNGDKSEAVLFALGAQAAMVDPKATVYIAGSTMELSADIRSLGVHMDRQLNMDRPVNSVFSSCYYHIRAPRHIRPSLNQETAADIGRSVVSSRLDFCNSLMYGISRLSANMKKLQRVQNALIRVICSFGLHDSVSGARRGLHWIPIKHRIIFKIADLEDQDSRFSRFNCRRRSASPYLCDLVHDYLPRRALRSGDRVAREVPRTIRRLQRSALLASQRLE